MKTILRTRYASIALVLFTTCFQISSQAQMYSTRANGNWNDPSTWAAGFMPPDGLIPVTATVNINHSVTYNGLLDITNWGTIRIKNSTGVVPVFTVAPGKHVRNKSTGAIYISDAEFRQYRYAGGGNSGTQLAGDFINEGGYIEIRNSIVEVADNWRNQAGGVRVFKKGLLLIGKDYEVKDDNTIDTLDKVAVSLGWQNGDMKLDKGKFYFNQAKIQLAGTNSKFDLKGGYACGDIDYITSKNHVTNVIGTGDIKIAADLNLTGTLNLDAYCVSSAVKYLPNGKFVGSQSMDCSLNYFPSSFVIQQSVNLSAGLGFSAPQPVGTASLAVGAQYKFANVNDTVDAIVRIDSLINGATVTTIDDNTIGVGYGFAFQPKVTSGQSGRSYAVFTISFYKAGTTTPVSLQYINATPLDIDGNAGLKEFAEVNMGTGALMNYMSSSSDISMAQLLPGSYRAQNVLGIERDNIDTTSYNNMFTVHNTDMSSIQVKYGTVTTSTQNSARQFSLFMKGFAYTPIHTLPVKMSSFTAQLTKDKVQLNWATASEMNASHFVVERSFDGTNFNEIGVVFAMGNTSSLSNYAFPDNVSLVTSKIVYYRLRTIDIDSKFEYSAVRMIRLSSEPVQDLQIITYPNPVTTELRVTIPVKWQNKRVNFEIISANGQPVRKLIASNGSQTEVLNLQQLAPGFYIVQVTCEGETVQQKIIKN